MDQRQVKGIWIPIEIWEDRNLAWNEKILLMEIDSFTTKGKPCFISNEYIENLLRVSERSARLYVSNLITKGYVRVVKFDGRTRYLESTLNYCRTEWQKVAGQTGQELPHTYKENTDINNNSLYKGFAKPTLDEVRAYCRERNNNVDAETFYLFYESKGWMVGKSKMKDWHSAIMTWEKREKEVPQRKRPEKESVLAHNLKVMDSMFGTNAYEQAYGKKEAYDEQ